MFRAVRGLAVGLLIDLLFVVGASIPQLVGAAIVSANPESYLSRLRHLGPGDKLALAAGTYREGLAVHGLDGRADRRIVIAGPKEGAPAVLVGQRGHNTVSIKNSSHITIRNLVLDGRKLPVDAVKAEGTAAYAHHITVENLTIDHYDADQQEVGISTKCPAWGWIIRNNRIEGAGTGMYLGDSDGSAPFIGGVIEGNLIRNTIGYNIVIKRQNKRRIIKGMPTRPAATIIRYNVFSKANSRGRDITARPNLFIGGQPPEGPGQFDRYLVYGNFFYQNPTEALFQGSGRIALYSNLFVNTEGVGRAITLMRHKGRRPETVDIFQNTIVASDLGIGIWDATPEDRQWVAANAVFAPRPIRDGMKAWNITGKPDDAASYLKAPLAPIGELDLYPRPGSLEMAEVPAGALIDYQDAGQDFNGRERRVGFVGAYAGAGENPGWHLDLARRPLPSGDRIPHHGER